MTKIWKEFFESEKAGGVVILIAAAAALIIANSAAASQYFAFLHAKTLGLSVEHWVNDGLMAIFFFLIGLELKREVLAGELSDLKKATLPIIAALGGVVVPAAIHIALNRGTPFQPGAGIPMATDIAFALGVLALAGRSVPLSLKVFLTALAVIDDLAAIIAIAVLYTSGVSIGYLGGAAAVAAVLVVLNRFLGVRSIVPYLVGGVLLWYFMLNSGVHATIAGVIAAFCVPFSGSGTETPSPAEKLEQFLHKPVAFVILPIFALANAGVVIAADAIGTIDSNMAGIIAGLTVGKPVGIFLFAFAAVQMKLCRLPDRSGWQHILGAGMLSGIGFTMSIFIANLAFPGRADVINSSKLAIVAASVISAAVGLTWLKLTARRSA